MKLFAIGLAASLLVGCASVINGTTESVHVMSVPSGATFTVKDKANNVVASGVTPQVVELKRGTGYFKAADYRIEYNKTGYIGDVTFIDHSLSPWVFGNIIFGGVIGGFIIDPLTGGMWELKEQTYGSLWLKDNPNDKVHLRLSPNK
ncbi:MAG: hypothetical protein QXN55_00685 [Candidatus Nitrosotenuis sp.]